ncbi:ABC transporter substrate-binding protein [Bradyrhizobium erythrophlei]|jgi:putative ABC transport system substrate-binding protein|uniref:Putative ABC transport system substrate-binding protein n=1 Tax=Bradyrhizobium erythrophlei TaxID=1437360 RepID=A0A1M5JHT5_9BRAD|nr:ABC transporter substrate-binding protein [Bradyrhizobium erythrophlei]SHG39965.1 putative ABC transport system substrate-binding protein [Bradyrhizobium erythrophlei]
MRRRRFIGLVGGAAASATLWPLAARAQQDLPVIGLLHAGSREENAKRLASFQKGLADAGFVEGQNVTIEYRWASGRNDDLPAMAADLVRRRVSVITTPGSTAAAVVASAATTTIPVVFSSGTDPVALGLVTSLRRPGGNVTGITSLNAELAAKRLGLLRELVPKAARYFALVKPTSELAAPFVRDLLGAAASLDITVDVLNADTADQIDAAFAGIPKSPGNVMVFGPEGFFYIHRARIADLALRGGLSTMFDVRDYVDAGGLASYGSDYLDLMELTGNYVARVLKGAKPADLPVQQATKFEFVINRKTARALGIEIPPTVLATADDVID